MIFLNKVARLKNNWFYECYKIYRLSVSQILTFLFRFHKEKHVNLIVSAKNLWWNSWITSQNSSFCWNERNHLNFFFEIITSKRLGYNINFKIEYIIIFQKWTLKLNLKIRSKSYFINYLQKLVSKLAIKI